MGTTELVFLGIVLAAYFVGTMLGFGTSILVVTFAAQLLPLDIILPVVAPLNLSLSAYLAVRHRQHTQFRPLLRRIAPLAFAGIPLGLLLFNLGASHWLELAFGGFVIVLASLQLVRAWRAREERALKPVVSGALLVGGGIVHGLFSTGGPLVVYALAREFPDKNRFRSTISTMFLPMTTALLVNYAVTGLYTEQVFRLLGVAVVPVLLGLFIGERVHKHVDNRQFMRAVWGLLWVGGIILTARAAF